MKLDCAHLITPTECKSAVCVLVAWYAALFFIRISFNVYSYKHTPQSHEYFFWGAEFSSTRSPWIVYARVCVHVHMHEPLMMLLLLLCFAFSLYSLFRSAARILNAVGLQRFCRHELELKNKPIPKIIHTTKYSVHLLLHRFSIALCVWLMFMVHNIDSPTRRQSCGIYIRRHMVELVFVVTSRSPAVSSVQNGKMKKNSSESI